jgi:hypothetical protein
VARENGRAEIEQDSAGVKPVTRKQAIRVKVRQPEIS